MDHDPSSHRGLTHKLSAALRFFLLRHVPGAWGRLRPRPYLASLNVTDNCCLKCVMCNQWQEPHSGELTTAEWKGIIAQLPAQGIREINLTGGEPLMRRDIFELIRHAREVGLAVGMTSNAFLMDDKALTQLLDSGVTIFNISVDALGERFDEIRGVRGAYARLAKAASALALARRARGIEVNLCFLLMKDTLGAYEEVVALARQLDLPVVINLFDVNPYFFQTGGQKERFWIGPAERKALKKFQEFMVRGKSCSRRFSYHTFSEIKFMDAYFKDPHQVRLPCYASASRLFIGPRGQVFGGCWALGARGDLRQGPLSAIMASPEYGAAQRRMFEKKCPGCSCGYSLNLRYAPEYVIQELVYRLLPWTRRGIYQE